jgi:hypothetical protein
MEGKRCRHLTLPSTQWFTPWRLPVRNCVDVLSPRAEPIALRRTSHQWAYSRTLSTLRCSLDQCSYGKPRMQVHGQHFKEGTARRTRPQSRVAVLSCATASHAREEAIPSRVAPLLVTNEGVCLGEGSVLPERVCRPECRMDKWRIGGRIRGTLPIYTATDACTPSICLPWFAITSQESPGSSRELFRKDS